MTAVSRFAGRNPVAAKQLYILQNGEQMEVRRVSLFEFNVLEQRFPWLVKQLRGENVEEAVSREEQEIAAHFTLAIALSDKGADFEQLEATAKDVPQFLTPTEIDLGYATVMLESFPQIQEAIKDPDFLSKTANGQPTSTNRAGRRAAKKPANDRT